MKEMEIVSDTGPLISLERLGIPYSGIAAQLLIAVQEEVLPKAEGRRQLKILLDRGRVNQTVFDAVWPQF